ncbi:MAG: NAD-dependent epimerase, partial [Bradymonadaceae bacterium]
GCGSAFFLVHGMSDVGDFEKAETEAAMHFLDCATETGLERIVYLGGLKPARCVSTHLRSRLVTGAILRSGKVSTIELRASMIIGQESASWRMLRDIAVRLPVMVVPRWLHNRTQPVAIDDVTAALAGALMLETKGSTYYDIPGPETLTFHDCIRRVARLVGNRPVMI